MSTPTLYYAPRTRAFTALWLLEELGVEYTLEAFAMNSGRHRRPDYLALNALGKVPLVVHDGVPVSEIGAIAVYLSDAYPDPGWTPRIGDADRAAWLRWIFFSSGVMEPAYAQKFFGWTPPDASVAWGSFDRMVEALKTGLEGRTWLLGDRFTTADVIVGATTRFGLKFGALPSTGLFADYVARLTARPAFERASVIEARESERFPPPSAT
jgi:glutathione S-transferase